MNEVAVLRVVQGLVLAGGLFCFCGPQAGHADDSIASRAREIYERNKDSVVKITGITQIRVAAIDRPFLNIPEQTKPFQTAGTLVTPEGFVVVALSTIDPSAMIDGREGKSKLGPVKVNASSTVKELEIILNDGTEIPATLVFKDTTLDLAIVRPKDGAPESVGVVFDPIDMTDSGTALMADEIVSLHKLKDLFHNASSVVRGTVMAVVERPRRCLLATNASIGCPAFTLDGKPLGIGAMRIDGSHNESGLVLVPMEEVRALIDQAAVAPGDATGADIPAAAATAD